MHGPKTIAKLKKNLSALRAYALGFPETQEEFPWDDRAIKVKVKVFVFMRETDISAKLPVTHPTALAKPYASPTHYGLGKSGWVDASFDDDSEVPVDELKRWILESYRAVAPAKLAKQVVNDASSKPKR